MTISRRQALTTTAAMAAGLAATGAGSIAALPGEDPVFDLIHRHWLAYGAHWRALMVADEFEQKLSKADRALWSEANFFGGDRTAVDRIAHPDAKGAFAILKGAQEAEEAALLAVLTIQPRTLRGAIALLDYVSIPGSDGDGGFFSRNREDLHEAGRGFMVLFTDALIDIGGYTDLHERELPALRRDAGLTPVA